MQVLFHWSLSSEIQQMYVLSSLWQELLEGSGINVHRSLLSYRNICKYKCIFISSNHNNNTLLMTETLECNTITPESTAVCYQLIKAWAHQALYVQMDHCWQWEPSARMCYSYKVCFCIIIFFFIMHYREKK